MLQMILGDYLGQIHCKLRFRPIKKVKETWACVVIVLSMQQDCGFEEEIVAAQAKIMLTLELPSKHPLQSKRYLFVGKCVNTVALGTNIVLN